MYNKLLNYLIFSLACFSAITQVYAQGWERIYFPPGGGIDYSYSAAEKIFLQDDGTYLFAVSADNSPRFLFTDADGFITDLREMPGINGTLFRSSDGNFVDGYRTSFGAPPEEDIVIRKFDLDNTLLWSYRPPGYLFGNETVTDIIQSSDGDYVLVGGQGNTSTNELRPYMIKIGENGDLRWKTVGEVLPENNLFGYSVLEMPDGSFFSIAASSYFSTVNPLLMDIRRLDTNGNLIAMITLSTAIQVRQAINTADGNILLLGRNTDYNTTLLKIDPDGNTIWEQVFLDADFPFSYTATLIETSDNGFAFLGNSNSGDGGDLYLIKTDANGELEWFQTYGGAFRDSGNDVKELPEGGYLIAGGANGQGEDQSLYLIKTDALGNSLANFIYGNVRYDTSEDCVVDADEQALEDWIVSATGTSGTVYATVAADGTYRMEVNAEDYTVTATMPNDYWMACVNDVMVTVVDSSEVDFAVQSIEQCPLMEVAVGNYGFRLCEEATINIVCSNQGTELAEDVYVEVTLADSLTLVDATLPFTSLGDNTYSFDVGAMDFLTTTTFSITVQVGCDIELMGQSLCVEAHIFPDTTCLPPDPAWSGASVELSAVCDGEEVILRIENVGDEAMPQALQYTVIEDHVIMLQDVPYGPLGAGESVELMQVADGTFYRIESPQVSGHPGVSMPSAFIEACGTGEDGSVSLGFINQYPIDDADFYEDINCTEVLAAYDPNIKKAFPGGYETDHFIESNTRIDYVIQFQNTGTATANKVVIVDRLAAELNPATIRKGAASHAYDFELLGNGIVQFTFNNIQLPDSTANEPGSHGYVSFSIEQQRDLPVGTVIENTAAIYFDFNPAIITNTTYHTIGEDYITVDVGDVLQANVAVKAYPNPFAAATTLAVSGENLGTLDLTLFDATGKVIRQDEFVDQEYVLSRNGLVAGIYFYRISNESGVLNTGKLIVQ